MVEKEREIFQLKIKEFTSAGEAVRALFPTLPDVYSSVSSIESLSPQIMERDLFLFARINGFGELSLHCSSEYELKQIKGVLIWVDQENIPYLENCLQGIVSKLPKGAGVWVLEQAGYKLTKEEKEQREAILRNSFDLKYPKAVIKKGTNFDHYWYGRKEKPSTEREYDLTADFRFQKLLREAVARHRQAGWEIIDPSEIIERCRHSNLAFIIDDKDETKKSKFINPDLFSLRLGFGFEVTAPCGCCWHFGLDGSETRVKTCIDPDCDGSPREMKYGGAKESRAKVILVGMNIPSGIATGTRMMCNKITDGGVCNTELMLDRVIDNPHQIISNLKCPHCGLVSNRRIGVDSKDLVREYTK